MPPDNCHTPLLAVPKKQKLPVLPGELSLRILWGPATAGLLTFGLLLLAFPPHDAPETAYVFLVPALCWLSFLPSFRATFITFLFFGWLFYMTLLWWLRHVTLPGLAIGSLLDGSFGIRLLSMLTLASAWTFTEWARCQFTLGFPWCPLSVSQWQRPVILQGAEWLGGWWVSFFLVFFNLCIASYLHHLLVRRLQSRRGGILGSFCPDFYVGLLMLCVALAPFFLKTHEGDSQKLLRAGFVQPYLVEKWKPGKSTIHKNTLR